MHTQHKHREDSGQTQFDDIKTQLIYGVIIGFLVYAGSPFSNNRTNAGLNPDDMYEIGTVSYKILKIKLLRDDLNFLCVGLPAGNPRTFLPDPGVRQSSHTFIGFFFAKIDKKRLSSKKIA